MSQYIHIEEVENALAGLEEAGAEFAIFSSLAWSQAGRLANLTIRLARIHTPGDVDHITNDSRREAATRGIEALLESTEQLLSYFARRTSPDLLPSGEDIATLIADNEQRLPDDSEVDIQQFAEIMDVSAERAEELLANGETDRQAQAEAQRRAAQAHRQEIVHRVDQAVKRFDSPGDTIHARDAIRILNKAADKIGGETKPGERPSMIERLEQEAARVRRVRRLKTLGARKRTLESIMDRIDDTIDKIEQGGADARPNGSEPGFTDERNADFGERTPEKEDEG